MAARAKRAPADQPYVLEQQIGFILRQALQRHAALFAAGIDADLTMTQWAALAKLGEAGPLSQNHLGRLTAMDAATIKGVIDRLTARGLTETRPDPNDVRRRLVSLTRTGSALVARVEPEAARVTAETLSPLEPREREALLTLLAKLR